VLTGIIVGVLLTIITDVMLHAIGVYPPSRQPMVNAIVAACNRLSRCLRCMEATTRRGSRMTVRCDTLWRGALWALWCVPLAQW